MDQREVLKLSLNLPALERLIGGAADIEVELRHQIVNEFIKKHLKQLVDSETVVKATEKLRKLMEMEIREQIGHVSDLRFGYLATAAPNLVDKIKEMVSHAAKNAVRDNVADAIHMKLAELDDRWQRHIETTVKSTFNKRINDLVNEEINRRLKIAAESK